MSALHEEWLESSATTLHRRAVRDFASSSDCEQMVTKPTHINGGVFDLVPTVVPDLVGIPVASLVVTSDHSVFFIDVVLEQPIPHLVCSQKVYLKNFVDCDLVKWDVKGLNWNKSIRSPCPVSSLNRHCWVLLRIEFLSENG